MHKILVRKFTKYWIKVIKIALRLLKCCKSGEISPNLVTLLTLQGIALNDNKYVIVSKQSSLFSSNAVPSSSKVKGALVYYYYANTTILDLTFKSGSSGLVVMEGDLWSRGCKLESRHLVLCVWFFTLICCKNAFLIENTKNKLTKFRPLTLAFPT